MVIPCDDKARCDGAFQHKCGRRTFWDDIFMGYLRTLKIYIVADPEIHL